VCAAFGDGAGLKLSRSGWGPPNTGTRSAATSSSSLGSEVGLEAKFGAKLNGSWPCGRLSLALKDRGRRSWEASDLALLAQLDVAARAPDAGQYPDTCDQPSSNTLAFVQFSLI
jgi:hypothetical protein